MAAGGEEMRARGTPTASRPASTTGRTPTNRAHQDADWLDFQMVPDGSRRRAHARTGRRHVAQHAGQGGANGEPTYENTRERGRAAGWWQGHEAWSNLCAGGTMGVGLRRGAACGSGGCTRDEPGHSDVLPWPGRRLARGAGLRGVGYVGAGRPHLARPPVRWTWRPTGPARSASRWPQRARRARAALPRRRPGGEADGPRPTSPPLRPRPAHVARSSSRRCWTRCPRPSTTRSAIHASTSSPTNRSPGTRASGADAARRATGAWRS